jgi:hypothetical protein
MAALYAALVFTVVLLVVTAYFLMGAVPLLILTHDVGLDARFVRGFFNTYYLAAMVAAGGAAASYGLAGQPAFALGAAAIVLAAAALRRRIIPTMDLVGTQIQEGAIGAIRRFRTLHVTALMVNLVQLVAIVWGLTALKL